MREAARRSFIMFSAVGDPHGAADGRGLQTLGCSDVYGIAGVAAPAAPVGVALPVGFGAGTVGVPAPDLAAFVPPPEIASPLELRVDVSGHSLNDWSRLRGRMYMRLDYADFGAWGEWLHLTFAVESGRGAFRAWVEFAQ